MGYLKWTVPETIFFKQ